MITASFRHLSGVGPLRERQLWLAGVRSWDEAVAALAAGRSLLAPRADAALAEGLAESRARLAAGDLGWFAARLPPGEQWRLLPHTLEGAACVDVECAGNGTEVTVVGVLDRAGLRCFVRGRDFGALAERSRSWTALISFNGLAFDVPALRRAFPLWEPPAVHVDLHHVFQRLRERGGLKALEPRVGFFRPPHLAALTGLDAVALWNAQRRGEPAALRRLVEYNLYDVFHLKPLAEIGYNRMLARTGLPGVALPVTDRGAMLYDVSRAVEAACAA